MKLSLTKFGKMSLNYSGYVLVPETFEEVEQLNQQASRERERIENKIKVLDAQRQELQMLLAESAPRRRKRKSVSAKSRRNYSWGAKKGWETRRIRASNFGTVEREEAYRRRREIQHQQNLENQREIVNELKSA